ncbi:MAG: hypothetical protein JNM64_18075, partial [Chloroflexia bacterium]|nr:hypothetical protein [Chloroflexia bacterium]
LRDLDRDMPIIMQRLRTLNPPPIRQPFPVMIGGGGEKVTLRIVAQHAHLPHGHTGRRGRLSGFHGDGEGVHHARWEYDGQVI